MQSFKFGDVDVVYDDKLHSLICYDKVCKKTLWVKKLLDYYIIKNILCIDDKIFVSSHYNDEGGMFFALSKKNGKTIWYIPGKTFLEVVYKNDLFLIFKNSEDDKFYLIKINTLDGSKIWFVNVDSDLYFYHFKKDCILLHYISGKKEYISYDGLKL